MLLELTVSGDGFGGIRAACTSCIGGLGSISGATDAALLWEGGNMGGDVRLHAAREFCEAMLIDAEFVPLV